MFIKVTKRPEELNLGSAVVKSFKRSKNGNLQSLTKAKREIVVNSAGVDGLQFRETVVHGVFGCFRHGGIPFTQVPTTGCGGVSSSDHGYP